MNTVVMAASEEAHNPLLPVVSEIVLALIVFAILFFAIRKYVVPSFEKTFAERTQAIEGGLSAAETKQAEADAKLAELEKQLGDARHEAARIREEAREQGAQIVAEMREQAQAESTRIVEHGKTQIEAERQQAVTSLRAEVGTLATGLASRIVGESLEDEARQSRVVERFLADLESQNGATIGECQLMMRGASADAYAAAAAALPGSGDLGSVAQDLFGIADLLRSEPSLRRVATDASIEGEAKAGLVRGVLAGKVSAEALEVLTTAVSQRWTASRDLGDALEQLGVVAAVRSTGSDAGRLEDEIFAVGQLVQANPELRDALSDPARSREDKAGLINGLLERQGAPGNGGAGQAGPLGQPPHGHRRTGVLPEGGGRGPRAGSRDRSRRPTARRRRPPATGRCPVGHLRAGDPPQRDRRPRGHRRHQRRDR